MTTTQNRGRSRKTGTPETAPRKTAAKTPAVRKSASKTSVAARKSATKAPVARKTVAAKTPTAAKPAAAPSLRRGAKPQREADVLTRLRGIVVKALDDLKARDVVEIDVRGKTSITDLIVIASGTSSRHVKSIADEVVKSAKQAGLPPIGVEGEREAEWVLVDLGDVIVHVMLPRTREFYGLERLWSVGDSHDELPIAG